MQVHIGAIGHGGRTKRQDLERFRRAFQRSLERKDNVQQAHTALLGHFSQKKADNFYRRALYVCPFLTEDELSSFMKQATCSIEDFKASLKRFERKIHSKNSPHLKDYQHLVEETSNLPVVKVESTVLRIIDAPFLMEQILRELRVQRSPGLILINKTSKNAPQRG
jgi:hypothetical protein